jgi:hypothetical protein
MTVYLQTTAGREEIALPKETVFVGVYNKAEDGSNNLEIMTGFEKMFSCGKIQRVTPEGVHITLECITANEPAFFEILERYRGISMVEIVTREFELNIVI